VSAVFRPIKSEKIYMTVIRQVKGLIDDGQLTPGDRLPPERELAAMLSVSRASVRQAISALEAQGIVEIRHGEGTFILEAAGIDEVIESFSRFLVAEQIAPTEILETRKIVECETARLCAERAAQEQINALERLLERRRSRERTRESLAQMNHELHMSIAEGSGNRALVKVMEVLLEMMRINMWPALKDLSERRAERIEQHLTQHEELVAAIARRDGEAAFAMMRAHLETIEREMRADLDAEAEAARLAGRT
jgi:GntR family transcriptional regulator, transcriptional repressor for pyruvate dehydrogenase complex